MITLHKRLLSMLLAVICMLAVSDERASAAESGVPRAAKIVIYDDSAGAVVTSPYAIEKGVSRHFTARVFDQNGMPMHSEVEWYGDSPAGYVFQDASGTGAKVKMTKDLYDDPNGFEPWLNIRACVGELCAWVCVNSVVNLTGKWTVDIKVSNSLFGNDTINIQFAQSGRNLVCTGIAAQPMTATLNGRTLQFYDPNKELTSFRGALAAKGRAQGQWASFKGYYGNWFAAKQ